MHFFASSCLCENLSPRCNKKNSPIELESLYFLPIAYCLLPIEPQPFFFGVVFFVAGGGVAAGWSSPNSFCIFLREASSSCCSLALPEASYIFDCVGNLPSSSFPSNSSLSTCTHCPSFHLKPSKSPSGI